MEFQVNWYIEVEADSHEDAARKAQAMQRDPDSTATVFEVVLKHTDKRWEKKDIDLAEVEEINPHGMPED
jgi:hypothetical protein